MLPDGQPKVSQAARQVTLHQDVFGLDVAVRYAWFGLTVCADLRVEVGEACHYGGEEAVHLVGGEGVVGEVVIE